MKAARFASLLVLMAACSSSPGGTRTVTGGSGGEDEGGTGGGTATGGKGGSPPKPDAAAPEKDSGAPDSGSSADTAPATDDCATAGAASLFCNTLRALPKTIKETGLFPSAPDFSKRPASLHEYSPDPALWSDGLEKQRFLLLPAGKKIDNKNPQRWDFPAGTVLVKTFFDEGGTGHRPVETRLIRRISADPDAFEQYDFNVYRWRDDGTDADLLDIEGGRTPVMITIKALGAPFMHMIPSKQDCGQCHESNGKVAQTFIGFDEARLNSHLAGKTTTQLADFAPLFTQPPPAKPVEIIDPDARLQRIKRFVFGNCVHCHNGRPGFFDMHPDMFVANTVGKPAEASGIAPPTGWLRVVPGKPEMSILYVEARGTMLPVGLKAMPPVGVAVQEAAPLADIRAWIMAMPAK
jgi:hypothetical protein